MITQSHAQTIQLRGVQTIPKSKDKNADSHKYVVA